LINDILFSHFYGELNSIFIQSKVLEIIFLEFQNLFSDENLISSVNSLKLDEKDIYAIKKAKEILIQNMKNPPSIIELAKKAKINDFKLKAGFKKVFNKTPYGLLLDYKMSIARKLLTTGDMNVNEVSKYIGYKYSQNFSTAFSKKFGILPKDVMKTKKYYILP